MASVLDGVRVLDLSWGVAGPITGMLLADHGGDVGGAVAYMVGEDDFLADLEIPEGMEPGSPRSGPIFTYTPWPSLCTAFLATTGINAALLARERTGRGQHVETSLLQAALTLT